MKKYKKPIAVFAGVLAGILLLIGAFFGYVSDFYEADSEEIAAFEETLQGSVQCTRLVDDTLVCAPDGVEPIAGMIFYPGGKVENESYLPLMKALAEKGVLCLLVEMPFNLAVLDIHAAKGLQEQFPEITRWYMGGHSLGGSMAASYLEKNQRDFEGLILLAAYSTVDLSKSSLDVLSIYGSEDGVLNLEKYNQYKSMLPEDLQECVIEGGCHGYFGMYGRQQGDGEATISNEEQIMYTAQRIIAFMGEAS